MSWNSIPGWPPKVRLVDVYLGRGQVQCVVKPYALVDWQSLSSSSSPFGLCPGVPRRNIRDLWLVSVACDSGETIGACYKRKLVKVPPPNVIGTGGMLCICLRLPFSLGSGELDFRKWFFEHCDPSRDLTLESCQVS